MARWDPGPSRGTKKSGTTTTLSFKQDHGQRETEGSLVERVWSYKTCKIIRNLLAPTKLYDAEYSVIVDKVKPSSHRILHNGSASVVAAGAKATPLECLVVVNLRRLAENCEFGVTLPDVLRDSLVCGVSNDRMHSGTVAPRNEPEVR